MDRPLLSCLMKWIKYFRIIPDQADIDKG